jgi:hypothetical protein
LPFDKAFVFSQELLNTLRQSCIDACTPADIRIRIPAIVIRIPTPRTAIRAIVPITACKQ